MIQVTVLGLAFIALALCKITLPFTDDETWEFFASQRWVESGIAATVTGGVHMHHPHGYYFILGRVLQLLGADEVAARCLGVAVAIATFLLARRILRTLHGGRDSRTEVLLAGLYFLAPILVQGSLIITADTGVHVLFITLFIAQVLERDLHRRRDRWLLAALAAATLWIKLVTPCLVLGGCALHLLLQRRWRVASWFALEVAAGGALIFWATWSLYCAHIDQDPSQILEYLLGVAGSRATVPSVSGKALTVIRHLITVLFWLGIPFSLLLGMTLWRHLRAGARDPRLGLLLTVGGVLFVAHTFVSGTTYGFPRYHFSALPIWCVIAAHGVAPALSSVSRGRLLVFGTVCAVTLVLLAGDPLHVLAFDLKAWTLAPPLFPAPTAIEMGWCLLLWAAPAPIALLLARGQEASRRRRALLVTATLAGAVALDIVQARAPYHTAIAYGEEGTEQVIAEIAGESAPGDEIVAGKDIVHHTVGHGYMMDWRWEEDEYLLARLRRPSTRYFVVGALHNTRAQLQRFTTDRRFQELLGREYRRRRIGTYLLWERIAGGGHPGQGRGGALPSETPKGKATSASGGAL